MITHTMPVSFGKRLANTSLNAHQLAELVVVLALTLMLFAWGMASAQAQESAAQTEPAYYLSPDAEGIYQIYQTIVGDDSSLIARSPMPLPMSSTLALHTTASASPTTAPISCGCNQFTQKRPKRWQIFQRPSSSAARFTALMAATWPMPTAASG